MLTSKKEFGQNIGMSYHIVALINEDKKKKGSLLPIFQTYRTALQQIFFDR